MCDAPSPREYLDASNDAASIQEIVNAMREGRDLTSGVICRTLKNGRPASILAIKHMRSYKYPDVIKFSLVLHVDMTLPDADVRLKVVNAIVKAIPL